MSSSASSAWLAVGRELGRGEGRCPALICCKAQGGLGGGDPFMIPHDSAVSPPGCESWGWMAGSPSRGWGSPGAPRPGPRMGNVAGLGLQGESPAKEGQAHSVVAGFGMARWGQPQCPPREVPVGCEGAGRCRRWGKRGKEEMLGGPWGRAGSGRCPTWGQGGHRGHMGVHWRPWHPSCAAVSACKENNPLAGQQQPVRCTGHL